MCCSVQLLSMLAQYASSEREVKKRRSPRIEDGVRERERERERMAPIVPIGNAD